MHSNKKIIDGFLTDLLIFNIAGIIFVLASMVIGATAIGYLFSVV